MKTTVINGGQKRELLIRSLQDMAPNVNEKDKALAIIQLDTSLSTINAYLKGNVANLPFAEALHNLFRDQIKSREASAA